MSDLNIKASFNVTSDGSLKKVGADASKASESLDKTSKSARNADRNLKGAAQASSNGTKNFSKMAQGISGTLVPAYATLAANVFALTAVFEFFKRASDLENLKASQVSYAQSTGVAIQAMSARLKEASQDMLGFKEAAQATAIGLAKGFSSSQMEDMAEGALKVANALGRPFEDSFDRLVRGISKAEPELLDELGITLKLKTATDNYAASIGKSADALTAAERSQAVYLEAMKQLEKQTEGASAAANPFVQLGNTFRDIINTITSGVLPVFKGLAEFMNNNAVAALAFFTLIGASIIKSFAPIDDMKSKFGDFVSKQKAGLETAKKSLESYRQKLKQAKDTVAQTQAGGSLGVQRGAAQALAAGSNSKLLQNIASGQANMFSGTTKANLKKSLAAAEREFAKTGKITKGIFKGVGIDIVRSIGGSLKQTEVKTKTTGQRMTGVFKNVGLRVKVLGATIKTSLVSGLSKAGKAASMFGSAMNKAMKATFILGMIQMIYDMVMAVVNAPATMIEKVASFVGGFFKLVQGIFNTTLLLVNKVIEGVNKIPGVNINKIEDFTFGDDLASGIMDYVKDTDVYKAAKAYETQRTETLGAKQAVDDLRDSAISLAGELGLLKELQQGNEKTQLEKDLAAAKGIQSLGVSGLMEDLFKTTTNNPEQRAKGLEILKNKLKDLADISPQLYTAMTSGDLELAQSLERKAGAFTANIAAVQDGINNLSTSLTSSTTALEAEIFVSNLVRTGQSAESLGKELGLTTDIIAQLDAAFEKAGGAEAFASRLEKIRNGLETIKVERHQMSLEGVTQASASGAIAQQNGLDNSARSLDLDYRQKQLELQTAQEMSVVNMNAEEKVAHDQRIQQLTRESELLQKKTEQAKSDASDIGQITNTLASSLTTGLQTAFQGIVDGTMKAKDAFANLAKSMLQSLAKIITELLVVKLLKSTLGGTSFGDALGITSSNRYGGVVNSSGKLPGYAVGGVARGPQSGYPVELHGTEAIVPLPNGKSIPVEMKQGGGTNNVVVNVSVDNQGNSQTTTEGQTSQDAGRLGQMIASAVQQELHNQKRSGGILNPYGVA